MSTTRTPPRWDPYPEFRPRWQICPGDQTADPDDGYKWFTVDQSTPCQDPAHGDCHIIGYLGDLVGTHRPATLTIYSRLPLTRVGTGLR